ncbi:hypothetical protein NP493_182g02038 [Ridgeia piscesae]|uniref:Uncharacterized protein n=1 Tax=Ridgeia piscesae TaxID=27915 RepID=A0AAD9P2N9_RIDPI|nr:hypothetical protein NP493_182g02038 [Ridgeia piscesae]
MERNSENQNFPSPPTMMCRTGCGFYGSASNDGMCSKCFKDALKRKQQNPSPTQVVSATHLANAAASSMASASDSLGATGSCTNMTSVVSTKLSPASSVSSMNLSTTPSVETAMPTVSTPGGSSQNKDKLDIDNLATDNLNSPSPSTSEDGCSDKDRKPKKNRCHTCKKKVGLTGFKCRCGGLFCSAHRYSDMHECTFDYKEMAQEQIRKNNPVVVGQKVEKI